MKLSKMTAKDYMSAAPVKFRPQQDVLEAINLMLEQEISGAPVLDATGDIIGLLSEKDCIKVALKSGYDQSQGGKVEDFMSRTVITVDADDSIMEIAKRFTENPFKLYPVVEDNRLIGQITRRDVLRAIQALSNG